MDELADTPDEDIEDDEDGQFSWIGRTEDEPLWMRVVEWMEQTWEHGDLPDWDNVIATLTASKSTDAEKTAAFDKTCNSPEVKEITERCDKCMHCLTCLDKWEDKCAMCGHCDCAEAVPCMLEDTKCASKAVATEAMACLDCVGCAGKFQSDVMKKCDEDHCQDCNEKLYKPTMECFVEKCNGDDDGYGLRRIAESYLEDKRRRRRENVDDDLLALEAKLANAVEAKDHEAISVLISDPEVQRRLAESDTLPGDDPEVIE